VPKHEYGQAGGYLQNEVLRRMFIWVGPPLLLCILAVAYLVMRPPWYVILLCVFMIPSVPMLAKAWSRGADKAIDPYVQGFCGERDVAAALRTALGEGCYLVHDLDFGKGNVDHVAVTPAGIFTIETKAYTGSVL
jgi:hypothetical protein